MSSGPLTGRRAISLHCRAPEGVSSNRNQWLLNQPKPSVFLNKTCYINVETAWKKDGKTFANNDPKVQRWCVVGRNIPKWHLDARLQTHHVLLLGNLFFWQKHVFSVKNIEKQPQPSSYPCVEGYRAQPKFSCKFRGNSSKCTKNCLNCA